MQVLVHRVHAAVGGPLQTRAAPQAAQDREPEGLHEPHHTLLQASQIVGIIITIINIIIIIIIIIIIFIIIIR
jgi:Flp pilus assembly protein TadB